MDNIMKFKNWKVLLALPLLMLLTACQTPNYNYSDAPPSLRGLYSKYVLIAYSGEIKEPSEVGIITIDTFIKVIKIDGKPVADYRLYKDSGFHPAGRFQLHLDPGLHSLEFGIDYSGDSIKIKSKENITAPFVIEAGDVIHLSFVDEGKTWTFKESDGSTDIDTIRKDFDELMSRYGLK